MECAAAHVKPMRGGIFTIRANQMTTILKNIPGYSHDGLNE
jgi:hypothetical protein